MLTAKYVDLKALQGLKERGVASHTWQSIKKGWELLRIGLTWQVGAEDVTLFWKDHWIGETPLKDICNFSLPEECLSKPVDAYIDYDGEWKVDELI